MVRWKQSQQIKLTYTAIQVEKTKNQKHGVLRKIGRNGYYMDKWILHQIKVKQTYDLVRT